VLSAASLKPVVPPSMSVNNIFVTVFAGEDLVLERKGRLATILKANDQFWPLSKAPLLYAPNGCLLHIHQEQKYQFHSEES
jgi:hypothetical protein